MRQRLIVGGLLVFLASFASAQSDPEAVRYKDAVNHGEAAQLILKIAVGYAEATPDPQTAHERLQSWGLVPVTWLWDAPLLHWELAFILEHIGIEYQPAKPDEPVSGVFLEALLWREVTKLRDYNARRLGHGFSANHVLDAGVDRAVSPSDFD
jgi:hypothetical protein